MVNISTLIQHDLKHVWHPCTQMKDFLQCPPLVVHKAKGSYLYTNQGKMIDAISSWWCKSLGHGHPAVKSAIKKQLNRFEHIIGATTTHPSLVELAARLAGITGKQHVFFASDGSSAVEIALKMTLHARQIRGEAHRCEFISLQNSYHGETLAALSVSDLGRYKTPYEGYGVTCHFIDALPYVSGINDPLWSNAERHWETALKHLEKVKANVCALIVEPIVQGSGGMLCYSAWFLEKLASWAKENDIYLIADEIMTGMCRTGKWLACQHANVQPDIICLSKGLTSGALPLSCVMVDHDIYQLFYADYDSGKTFWHSHTHSGNALAVSAALATVAVMESENINQQTIELGLLMQQRFTQIALETKKLSNIRSLGGIVAGDLLAQENGRTGQALYQEALKRGALLRPLGNTLYWLPPLNIDAATIDHLAEITLNSINAVYG